MTTEPIPDTALHNIAVVLDSEAEITGTSSDLWFCCKKILQSLHIESLKPVELKEEDSIDDHLAAICENNKLRFRKVKMHDKQLYQYDHGPLLCFYKETGDIAALIPGRGDKYLLYVPALNIKQKVNRKELDLFLDTGYVFYRTLADTPMDWKAVFHFARQGLTPEFLSIFLLQGIISLLGLLIPIATGIIFDAVIPNASISLLTQFAIVLTVNVLIISLLNINLVIASIRIRLKINAELQASVWDRIVRLPLRFFRRFSTGDLVMRAGVVNQIQQEISSSVMVSFISGLMSVLSFILLFYIAPSLAWSMLALVFFIMLVSIVNYIRQIYYLRKSLHFHGALSGFSWQMLNSLSKLKINNSLGKAFEYWSDIFSSKMTNQFKSGKIMVNLTSFTTFFNVIATTLLFTLVFMQRDTMSFGTFIIFNAAFAQFMIAIFSLIATVAAVLRVIPLYERAKPIFETTPEYSQQGFAPPPLTGKIDIVHVGFKYHEDLPMVFKDLSINIKPGSKVVITGASGSGKSTLFSLLLGFEKLDSGHIYFDDFDLQTLNLSKLRQQIGVVLQDTLLFPGSILDNIQGAKAIPIEKVWDLLDIVALRSEIEEMPMGLHTLVMENGRTLSMGQRQRILLARALSKDPAILILDEATSALDKMTSEHIENNLAKLNMTQIISTHKPDSIKTADQIINIKDLNIRTILNDGSETEG